VDSGNALFRHAGNDPAAPARAQFILRTMGQLGTVAMAAGARDLVLGATWLKTEAQKAKVEVLSANLVDGAGKPLFAPSKIVEVGGKKVALIGISPAGPVPAQKAVVGKPAVEALRAEARKLRPRVDLIVVLAAVPYAEAMALAREVGGAVDLLLQSHEGRGQGSAQRIEGNYLMPSGERGKQVGRLDLHLDGKGPLLDLAEVDRDRKTLQILDTQTAKVQERAAKAQDAQTKQALQQTLATFEQRKKELRERIEAGGKATGRRMRLDFVSLTPQFPSDPAIAAEASKHDPGEPQHVHFPGDGHAH
jgi:2',3'-cyclic-nucleotide 2'-phosphodiesterase (5'-nucleotidase family)